MMVVLLLGAVGAQHAAPLRSATEAAPRVAVEKIPLRIGGWRGRDLGPPDEVTLKMLVPDAYLNREYVSADGLPAHLAVIYGRRKTSFHSPGFCLLGGGWNIVAKSRFTLRPVQGAPITANRFLLMRQGRQAVVVYYYAAGQRTTPSWVAHQAYLAWDRFRGRAAVGALVRLTVPARSDAVQRGAQLLARLHPHLEKAVSAPETDIPVEGRSSVQ